MNHITWHEFFMTMVYIMAMKSKDESTKIGAIIVDGDEIIATGFNGIPRKINDAVERLERPEKYFWIEHAERNAIYNAAKKGFSVKDTTIYTNGIPCCECARAIVQSGIKRVVYDSEWEDYPYNKESNWSDSLDKSKKILKEGGVTLNYFNGKIIRSITKIKNGIIF